MSSIHFCVGSANILAPNLKTTTSTICFTIFQLRSQKTCQTCFGLLTYRTRLLNNIRSSLLFLISLLIRHTRLSFKESKSNSIRKRPLNYRWVYLFSFISCFLHQHAHAFPSGGEFWACFNWSFLSIADYPSHTHCYDTQTTVSGRHRHRLFGERRFHKDSNINTRIIMKVLHRLTMGTFITILV